MSVEIRVDKRINRYDTKDRTLVLNNLDFLVIDDKGIIASKEAKGLYINANDVIAYIQKNLFGHDKKKYGVKKNVGR